MALDKQKKELIIIGAAVVVLLLIVMSNFKGKKKAPDKPKAAPSGEAESAAPPAGAAAAQVPLVTPTKVGGFAPPDEKIIQAQLRLIAETGPTRDPFYLVEGKSSSKRGSLVLKGISWKEHGSSFAIINEEIVKAGDSIADSKIVAIEKKSVTLEKDGQEYILILEDK